MKPSEILARMTAPSARAPLAGEPYGLATVQRTWVAMKELLEYLAQEEENDS